MSPLRIINNICAWRSATDYIMDIVYKCYDMGRKTLVLSDEENTVWKWFG